MIYHLGTTTIYYFLTILVGILYGIYLSYHESVDMLNYLDDIPVDHNKPDIGDQSKIIDDLVKIVNETPATDLQDDKQKVIVKYKNNQYDITDFVFYHPGGKKVLLSNNGQDVEQLMLDNSHSVHAYQTLEKYKI